jgi:serine/threonine protein kinase/Tol biopolymer transport system component
MALPTGIRLGPYEIRSMIGAGGVGEVYRAYDTTLGRDVAIKVLRPESLSHDPARIARFEREARVLASLSHANIAAIYGLEQSTETRALVLELVEGPTLEDRILQGRIPIAEALRVASQIAEALEAAHEQGVIHRDLKPANIKLRRDGTVKVLDFGLAKLVDEADATESVRPTMLTHVGAVFGTAPYMSPEQAKGQPADKRSDIWAFGCVLFEMLTGRRAFEGHDMSDTLVAVLTKTPEWSALPAELPPAVRALLMRCLDRDPRKRIGDIAAARFVLSDVESLNVQAFQAGQHTRPERRMSRVATWATALAAPLILLGVVVYQNLSLAPETAFTFSVVPPDGTTFLGVVQAGPPALSPDGRLIAFVAEGAAGRSLWVQSIDAFDARSLPGSDGANAPFWSPDAAWLGFQSGLDLKKVSLAGGQPQVIARANTTALGVFGATWNRDDTVLFYGGTSNTLASVSASGGGDVAAATERHIDLFDENHIAPAFLPDGRHYLLVVRGGKDLSWQLYVGELGSNERRPLISDVTNARYAPPHADAPGYLLYVRDRKLMAHRFDADTLTLSGTPTVVAADIAVSGAGGVADFSVSSNGVLAYRRMEPAPAELAWYDRAGQPIGTLGDRPGNPRGGVRISPDGKWAAFTRAADGVQDVWIADLARGGISRFTLAGGRSPVWSPDGSQLAFLRDDTIYRKPFADGGPETALWSGPGIMSLNDWSGDGNWMILTRWDTSKPALTGRGLWLLPNALDETANHEPALFESMALHGQFGPKVGPPRWVAFDGGRSGTASQIFVRTMPGSVQGMWQVSTDGGNTLRWRADGRELYFLRQGTQLFAVDIDGSGSFQASAPRRLFAAAPAFATATSQYAPGWDVTPDGQRFLTTFPVPEKAPSAITVVMNWQSMLEAVQ